MLDLRKFHWLQIWIEAYQNPFCKSFVYHILCFILLSINFHFNKHEKDIFKSSTISATVIKSSEFNKLNNKPVKDKGPKNIEKLHKTIDKKLNNTSPKVKTINDDFSKIQKEIRHNKSVVNSEFDKLLKDVKRNKKKFNDQVLKENIQNKASNTEAFEASTNISSEEENEIKRQIYPKWSIPAGIKNAESYYVDIEVMLAPDGTVKKTVVVSDVNSMELRIIAESAIRAILLASPLKFTSKKRAGIRNFILRFDLKEALS